MVEKQASQQTEEQEQLHKRLMQIAKRTDVSAEAKAQMAFSAVRDFVVRNPSQITPEMARSLAKQLEALKTGLQKTKIEYDTFIGRHYNPYNWDQEHVVRFTAAKHEIDDSLKRAMTALDISISRLERFAAGKHDEPPIFRSLGPSPTREDDLRAALEGMATYNHEAHAIQKPIEEISAIMREVKINEENTARFGKIMVGTAFAVTGMWLAAVLEVGIGGAAIIGAAKGGISKTTEKIISEGELPSGSEALFAVLFGAATGAVGKVPGARDEFTTALKGAKIIAPAAGGVAEIAADEAAKKRLREKK